MIEPPITDMAADLMVWLAAHGLTDAREAMAVMGIALVGLFQTNPDPRAEGCKFCTVLLSTLEDELKAREMLSRTQGNA